MLKNSKCKICRSSNLKIIYHVAICKNCKVLLFYPYPENDKEIFLKKKYTKDNIAINDNIEETKKKSVQSHYFIKFDNELTEELFNNLKNINYTCKNNTCGPKSISKQELIKEFNKIIV